MVNIFTILFGVMPNNQPLLLINEPFCHQSRQNIGCRLTLSLVTNGMITGKKLAIVSEKMVHILIIHACHIVTSGHEEIFRQKIRDLLRQKYRQTTKLSNDGDL